MTALLLVFALLAGSADTCHDYADLGESLASANLVLDQGEFAEAGDADLVILLQALRAPVSQARIAAPAGASVAVPHALYSPGDRPPSLS